MKALAPIGDQPVPVLRQAVPATDTYASWREALASTECRIIVAATLAGSVVFCAVGIGRPVWLDEAYAVLIASRGFSGIVDTLRHENNLPSYCFLLSVWMRLFGDSEIAARALSALFYLGGAGATFVLGKRIGGTVRAAWYSAFFYLSSPLAIRNAQNIRMYALLGLLSALSILVFLRLYVDRDRSRKAIIFSIGVNVVGLSTHIWFGFVVAGQFLALLAWRRGEVRRFLVVTAAAAAPVAALWGPFLVEQAGTGATQWMPRLQWALVATAATEFYGFLATVFLFGLAAMTPALVPVGKRRQLPADQVRMLLVIAAASLSLALLICLVKPIYWPGRYAIITLSPIAALLGIVLSTTLPRPMLAGMCLCLLAANTTTQFMRRNDVLEAQLPAGQSDRTSAAFLLEHAAPGDAVVFTSLTRAAADYYFRRAHAESRFVEVNFPGEVAAHLGWADPTIPPGRRAALENEAEAVARRLQSIATAGRTVWLYEGFGLPVSHLLKERLDSALKLRRQYPLAGPYHNRILEYGST